MNILLLSINKFGMFFTKKCVLKSTLRILQSILNTTKIIISYHLESTATKEVFYQTLELINPQITINTSNPRKERMNF